MAGCRRYQNFVSMLDIEEWVIKSRHAIAHQQPSKHGLHKNREYVIFTCYNFFSRLIQFLVLCFETNFVWAPMVEVHRVKNRPFYIMDAMF
jgi:hypothetical protein